MIEFKTEYNKKIIAEACKISIKQILIPMIVISLGFLGLAIFNFWGGRNILEGLLWLIFAIAFIPIFYFITYFTQTGKYNSMYLRGNLKEKKLVDTYQFNEKSIIFSTDLGDKNISTEKANYDYFVKVIETKNDYILFKTKLSICVIPKSSLTQGSFKEFDEILKNQYGDSFKKKCR